MACLKFLRSVVYLEQRDVGLFLQIGFVSFVPLVSVLSPYAIVSIFVMCSLWKNVCIHA